MSESDRQSTKMPQPAGLWARLNGSLFRSLRQPNYRRYFLGQGVSVMGTWMQSVALSWLVYRLTGSAALLGVVAFLSQAPQLVVSPLAGLLIDRCDRRWLLIRVQWLLFLQSGLLALLTLTGWIAPWNIVLLAGCFGVLNALDTPLRHALIGAIVTDKQDLPNAIALNAVVYNAARFVVPPLAGVLLGLTSEALCFALNAVSYLAIARALKGMQLAPHHATSASRGAGFGEGLRFARGSEPVRLLLGLTLLMNVTASSYVVLVPVLAKGVFAGGVGTLGILLGASGCGALVSTAYVALQKTRRQLGRNVVLGWCAVSSGMLVLATTHSLPFGLYATFALGFGISMANVATNSLLMSSVPDRLRGRMISTYTGIRFGMDAVGGLIVGTAVSGFGLAPTLAVETVLVLLGLVWCLARRAVHYQPLPVEN
ncbi:MAG: MFS transporter [Pseudogulbenkiania sp.]|nr:MFS transporter [Pseudogulbenkiania sp.]